MHSGLVAAPPARGQGRDVARQSEHRDLRRADEAGVAEDHGAGCGRQMEVRHVQAMTETRDGETNREIKGNDPEDG